MKKITNEVITTSLLQDRATRNASLGYPKQKWIEFCEALLPLGCILTLYEARQTASKYITVRHPIHPDKSFKVRFSNHKPIRKRELQKDCDFFVGVTHLGVTRTIDALYAVDSYFGFRGRERNVTTKN